MERKAAKFVSPLSSLGSRKICRDSDFFLLISTTTLSHLFVPFLTKKKKERRKSIVAKSLSHLQDRWDVVPKSATRNAKDKHKDSTSLSSPLILKPPKSFFQPEKEKGLPPPSSSFPAANFRGHLTSPKRAFRTVQHSEVSLFCLLLHSGTTHKIDPIQTWQSKRN